MVDAERETELLTVVQERAREIAVDASSSKIHVEYLVYALLEQAADANSGAVIRRSLLRIMSEVDVAALPDQILAWFKNNPLNGVKAFR